MWDNYFLPEASFLHVLLIKYYINYEISFLTLFIGTIVYILTEIDPLRFFIAKCWFMEQYKNGNCYIY